MDFIIIMNNEILLQILIDYRYLRYAVQLCIKSTLRIILPIGIMEQLRQVFSYQCRLVLDPLFLYSLKLDGCHTFLLVIGRAHMLFLNAIWLEEGLMRSILFPRLNSRRGELSRML